MCIYNRELAQKNVVCVGSCNLCPCSSCQWKDASETCQQSDVLEGDMDRTTKPHYHVLGSHVMRSYLLIIVKGRVLFLQSTPTTVEVLGPHHCHCPSVGCFLYRWANFKDTCRERSICWISDLNHKVLLMHSVTFYFNLPRFCGLCCHLLWNPTQVKIWMAPL